MNLEDLLRSWRYGCKHDSANMFSIGLSFQKVFKIFATLFNLKAFSGISDVDIWYFCSLV